MAGKVKLTAPESKVLRALVAAYDYDGFGYLNFKLIARRARMPRKEIRRGRTVIYQDHGRAEAGTLTSWRGGIVFARYSRGDTAAGADPKNLSLAVTTVGAHP